MAGGRPAGPDGFAATLLIASGNSARAQEAQIIQEALKPLGIQPVLETREIAETAFNHEPAESNRIWMSARPLAEWLRAEVGSTECCSVCGNTPCRTLAVGGAVFEAVPEELSVKAGLLAAANLVARSAGRQSSCGGACNCEPSPG